MGQYTTSDLSDIYNSQNGQCVYCNIRLKWLHYHIDHIVPIKRGGTNHKDNIQILCARCNVKKGAQDPKEYENAIGFLRLSPENAQCA